MNKYVIKIGGSVISRDPVSLLDMPYLFRFRDIIKQENINTNSTFIIITGGGALMRKYRDILIANSVSDNHNIHWIGTTVNVLHAYVLKAIFAELADEEILKYEDYYSQEAITVERTVQLGGGGRPGHSGDVDAVIAAKRSGANIVFSLKNIDGVYTADPKKDANAKKLDHVSWQEYLNIIGNPTEHAPGANYPIDPIASRMASEAGIKFIILDGNDLDNFQAALNDKTFVGTTVS